MGELADEKALQKTLVGETGFKQISPGGLRTWAELQQHVARQKAVKQLLNTPLPKNVKGPPDKDERIQLRCLDSAQIGLVSLPGVAAGMPGTPKVNQDYGFVMYPVVPCGTDGTFRVGTLIAGVFDGHGKGGESISRIAALKVAPSGGAAVRSRMMVPRYGPKGWSADAGAGAHSSFFSSAAHGNLVHVGIGSAVATSRTQSRQLCGARNPSQCFGASVGSAPRGKRLIACDCQHRSAALLIPWLTQAARLVIRQAS